METYSQEKIFENAFEYAAVGMTHTSLQGKWLRVNRKLCEITGYSREELLQLSFKGITHPDDDRDAGDALRKSVLSTRIDAYDMEKRYVRKDGKTIWVSVQMSVVYEQERASYVISVIQDISERKQAAQLIESLAYTDALTGLANRSLLGDRLHQAMTLARRHKSMLAVVFLDLDGFKAVNDSHGHATGDLLLRTLAARMNEGLREGDTLARLGGDEFVAVLLDLNDASSCTPMLTRLLQVASTVVPIGEARLQVSASLGVTFYPQSEEVDADQLLRQADQAMYQAKLSGKNRFHVFDAEKDRSVRGHHASLERIRLALQNQEFVLHYQPKVNMRSRQVLGAEALIRWDHPQDGLLPPAEFLPVVENHPLSVDIGEWVIRQALQQLSTWQDQGIALSISVNISALHIQRPDFLQRLTDILAEFPGLLPHSLQLEILETSALEDLEQVAQFMERCKALSVGFALDDFGTGYSSLTYLKRLPIHTVKLDQSFVRDMMRDPDNVTILDGVLWIMRKLQRSVVAEGVETLAHARALIDLGCELAQGYGIARPMPVTQWAAWCQRREHDSDWQALTQSMATSDGNRGDTPPGLAARELAS